MSKTAVKPVSRKSNLVTREFEKEILAYDLITNKAFSLNETSSLIWNLCDGTNSVSEIVTKLRQKLDSSVDEDFIWLALEQFRKDNLLENNSEIETDFGGLSRREVIRKVGLATMLTLPIVSSLVAPTAIKAVSSVACSTGSSCRCPNATPNSGSCDGSAGTVTNPANPSPTITVVNCDSQGNNSCQCVGPFLGNGSGNPSATSAPNQDRKLSTVGCATVP